MGRGMWRGVPLSNEGGVCGGGCQAVPLPRQSFRFWILNRRILVQTESFLYSSPKAGLNAVLGLGIGEGQNVPYISNLYAHVKLREGGDRV